MGWVLSLLLVLSAPLGELKFVRGGLLAEGTVRDSLTIEGTPPVSIDPVPLGPDKTLYPWDWEPETAVRAKLGDREFSLRSPRRPTPAVIGQFLLEDVSAAAAARIAPDACVRFSPDSRLLAVGSYGGWLRVIDVPTGQVVHRQRIPEGMAKRLAWSPDGKRLYVGEQSPDANLMALDAGDGYRLLWTFRLADVLETSRPAADDSYGRYTLPAVFDLQVTPDGRLFVCGVHSWRVKSGEGSLVRNRSQIVSLDSEGKVQWRFPSKPAPVTIVSLGMDPAGQRLALFVHQSQPAEPGQSLESGSLYVVSGGTGSLVASLKIAPEPHFERAESWDSVAVSPKADRVALGLQDGRAMLYRVEGKKLALESQFDLGRAVQVGNIPIAAAASYARIFGNRLYLQTQNTHIPLASSQAALQPPSMHRGANMLTVTDLAGVKQWLYRGPFSLSGSWTDETRPGGRWLLCTCRELPGAAEPGQYGALVFDLARAGSGSQRLDYYYATLGPVFALADISPDGRLIAVVEIPAVKPNGRDLFGTHQVHVVH